jgi:ubiquinone/menaquinone biosynthesis C-methylase UbiE
MTTQEKQDSPADVRSGVREHYGKFAADFDAGTAESCCGPSDCCGTSKTNYASMLYKTDDLTTLPEDVTGLSAGCGDPVTLASLEPGQTVLDLGSGGGIDVFLAAKRVGDSGKVIGVDMTAEMIERARANKEKMGVENAEFRLGEIEHLPVADETVDVIISNCVINLSPDKPQVFRDAFRVLRPGGRIAVSDIVTDGPLPDELKESLSAWYGCLAGALDVKDYIAAIEDAGFVDVELAPERMDEAQMNAMFKDLGIEERITSDGGNSRKAYFMVNDELKPIELGDVKPPFSAKVTARKPKK